ncbi:MAG: xylose isomerase, partial [Clostridia bacterium]|nr:xylose isomerase [Clostridia bacterium]
MTEFYPGIAKIPYEGSKSKNPLAYKYYNANEIIAGKKMSEHLKFAMSYWHTMVAEGSDMFGVGTLKKDYGSSDPMESARNKAYAAFELMDKLGIEYYCFHDRDIAPEGATLAESNARLDEISDLLLELNKKYGKKVLWGTANMFSNPRFAHGAGTAPNADVFAFAAGQIKKALDLTVKLGGNGYVFWGGREGYETLLNTN